MRHGSRPCRLTIQTGWFQLNRQCPGDGAPPPKTRSFDSWIRPSRASEAPVSTASGMAGEPPPEPTSRSLTVAGECSRGEHRLDDQPVNRGLWILERDQVDPLVPPCEQAEVVEEDVEYPGGKLNVLSCQSAGQRVLNRPALVAIWTRTLVRRVGEGARDMRGDQSDGRRGYAWNSRRLADGFGPRRRKPRDALIGQPWNPRKHEIPWDSM